MFTLKRFLMATVAACISAAAAAQVTSYDATSSVLTIPSVSVGAATFTNVTLRNTGNFTFSLLGATAQTPAAPGVASYDGPSNLLTLPAVKVGDATFIDVKLLNTGNYVFTLQAATALPQSVSDEVSAFARSVEAQFATAVPATGAARLSLTDACWRSNGRTRANFIADYDANIATYAQRDAYLVGRKVQNLQVLALRNLVNPDGSARREIDIQLDVAYRDGTTARQSRELLISGSSAGTAGCSSPQTGATLRTMGNQQLVQTDMRSRNLRDERYSITTGAVLSPAVNYSRTVLFQISDPMGNATYVVMTGPGPAGNVGGVATQFSLKFLSPRILRSAPELAAKNGNFVNWLDDDGFNFCRITGSNVPVAAIADCVSQGATSGGWGWTTSTPNAAADQSFVDQGWVEGGTYRFDVYNDDGWKTVNGQAGKTPIATYYDTLDRLPYTFVAMTDKYPLLTLKGQTMALLAANVTSATPAPVSFTWTTPTGLPEPHQLFQIWEFNQGAKTGNVGTTFYPAYRALNRQYPGTQATGLVNWPVAPRHPDQANKTYVEFLLYYSVPGTFNQVRSNISFQ